MQKIVSIGLLLLISQTAKAVFIRSDSFYNPTTDQNLHVFADLHIDEPSMKTTLQQSQDFIPFVKNLGPDTLVITEDAIFKEVEEQLRPLSPEVLMHLKELEIKPREKEASFEPKKHPMAPHLDLVQVSPLMLSTFACKWEGIDVENVECREQDPTGLVVPDSAIQETLSYNDGPELTHYYKEALDIPKRTKVMIKGLRLFLKALGKDQAFADQVKQKAREMNTFTTILDTKIIHTLYNAKQYKNIVIIAGANHAYNIVKPITQILGYQHISSTYKSKLFHLTSNSLIVSAYLMTLKDQQLKEYLPYIAIDILEVQKKIPTKS